MPVTVKVNGTSNSLVHKGSSGISTATVPDVCKTPSPGGPVPMPYPNISQSATLAKGTTTVKADGMMVAIKGSEFSLSNGDNAGVAGGVKSSTFMKESTWILYSFDVKMDGQNACRLSDKKFQNHENTADMAGVLQQPLAVTESVLQDICCKCDEEVKPGPYDDCASLGAKKHACCEDKLMKEKGIGGERGYKPDGSPFTNGPRAQLPGEDYWTFRRRIAGTTWPDAVALDTNGNPAKFYDFKFGCDKDVPVKMRRDGTPTTRKDGTAILAKGDSKPVIGPKQQAKYQRLAKQQGLMENGQPVEPQTISNKDCPS
jgi:uncharacterized Zn-binding protein involved in type VI secretion